MRNNETLIDQLQYADEDEIIKHKKVIDAVHITKELNLLDKDPVAQLLLLELSKTPEDEVLWRALKTHLKPFLIKHELKPPIFKTPPEE